MPFQVIDHHGYVAPTDQVLLGQTFLPLGSEMQEDLQKSKLSLGKPNLFI